MDWRWRGRSRLSRLSRRRAALAQTEDQGNAAFYRFLPRRRPRESGDLASFGGRLEALAVRGRPNFDANTAEPGQTFQVEWVKVEEPNPPANAVRVEAQSKGAAIFDRTEGAGTADDRIYFDCTTGGEAQGASCGSSGRAAATAAS